MTVTKLIEELLKTTELSNQEIVDKVKLQFPNANTSTKSVASTASVMRRFGIEIAKRKATNPTETIANLEAEVAALKQQIASLEQYAGIEIAA